MINDILIYTLSLFGLIGLLLGFVFKMIAWRIEDFTVTIPLNYNDECIFNKIYNIRSFFEFCGIEKKCTVVLINYGAPKWFCDEILNYYEKYDFLKIISSDEICKNLF